MSLLIDALRKAEEDRRPPEAAPLRTATFTRDIELEPLANPVGSAHIGPVADTPPTPPPAPSRTASPRASHTRWLLLGGASLATTLAITGWIWLETQATTLAHAGPPALMPPTSAAPPSTGQELPVPAPQPEAVPPALPTRPVPRPALRHPPTAAEHAARATSVEAPLRFRPGQPEPAAAPPLILTAHDAYTAGDLPRAQALYRQALQNNPANPDALHGLGAIALQQGRPEQAETLFRRALLLNPHDPIALAGLSQTPPTSSRQSETRLRTSLAEQPDAIATHSALGDSLAAQQRWAEAQQAYFQAHSLAPDNPDLAYNLAVSLDHLGQRRPAATYYRKALELAAQHPARFSRPQGETRLQALRSPEPTP